MNILITEDNYFERVRLIKFIQKYDKSFNIVCFENYDDTIEYVKNNRIDLAFLDIKLNEDNGYELAQEMKKIDKEIYICFVSGYSENAITAFKLDAIGFIEKPYDFSEVSKVLERFMNMPKKNVKNVFIKTFGKFEVFINDEILNFSSAKSKEFLAFLVNSAGESVSLDEIVANVFGEETENGYNYLRIIFHRLNKTLKDNGIEHIIGHQKNNYYINKKQFLCDLYEVYDNNIAYFNLYQGKYMEGYCWSVDSKEKIFYLINKVNTN